METSIAATAEAIDTARLQPTSRVAAIRAMRSDGKRLDELDISKFDQADRIVIRKEWREVRKALLGKLDKAGQDAFRAAEKARNVARKTARQANRKAGPPTIRIEKSFLEGIAATIEHVARAIADGKPTVGFVTPSGKLKMPPAEYLPVIATAIRKQMEKPVKAVETWLVVKTDKATGTQTAYDDRYATQKRAAARAKKLQGFLELTGFAGGHSFDAMALEDARKNGVADIKEDRPVEEAA